MLKLNALSWKKDLFAWNDIARYENDPVALYTVYYELNQRFRGAKVFIFFQKWVLKNGTVRINARRVIHFIHSKTYVNSSVPRKSINSVISELQDVFGLNVDANNANHFRRCKGEGVIYLV